MSPVLEIIAVGFVFVGAAIAAVALHKLRRVHTMLYAVATKDDVQQIYRQIEALQYLYRELTIQQPLPPLRGYAASPDFLREVVRTVRKSRPQCAVELGSGASTIVTARALELNRSGHLYSIEHDPEYAAKTRDLLREHGLQSWVTVVHAPLTEYVIHGETYRWYSLENLPEVAIDMLVIDGPPAMTQKHARYPALPMLRARLSEQGVAIVDDTSRREDAEVVARWSREYPELVFTARDCEKGCVRIESVSAVNVFSPPVSANGAWPRVSADAR